MSRRGVSTTTQATVMLPPLKSPTFATFLLPSFSIPFRRRPCISATRRSSLEGSESSGSSPVPSLSSSPTSIYASDPATPIETGTYFPIPSATFATPKPSSSLTSGSVTRVHPDTIRCGTCASDLAFGAQIVSKCFHGRHGRAYLISPGSSLATSPSVPGLYPEGGHHEVCGASELANIHVGQPEKRMLVTGQHTVADISCAVCGVKLGWKYVDAKEVAQRYKIGKFILETERVVVHRSWEDLDGLGDLDESVGTTRDEDGVVIFDSDDEEECEDIFSGTWDPVEVSKRRESRTGSLKGKKFGRT